MTLSYYRALNSLYDYSLRSIYDQTTFLIISSIFWCNVNQHEIVLDIVLHFSDRKHDNKN